jgi:hypothetical protein
VQSRSSISTIADVNDFKHVNTRFNVKSFSDVIQSLDDRKKRIISSFGFGSLLEFGYCSVPLSFAAWVCCHINCKLEDIVVNNKSIKLSPGLVHDVLGLPIGGHNILREGEDGRHLFMSKVSSGKRASVYELKDRMRQDDLSDDDVVRIFLSLALSFFLCPSASVVLSPKYLGPLVDIAKVKEWDWSQLVFDWLMKGVARFQRLFRSRSHKTTYLCSCLFYVCVSYLPFLSYIYVYYCFLYF